ncbi:MAG TPA: hypothetical protein DCG77_17365, partial [Sphingobacterium sp.]|nr:hypothetical protein [Sphingobacterium sp.]
MKYKHSILWAIAALPSLITACKRNDAMPSMSETTITIENVLDSKPLVESGRFKNNGASPVIMPGEAISIKFSAAKGQALSLDRR